MNNLVDEHVTCVTAVINAHCEGEIAAASIASLVKNTIKAREAGFKTESIAVLDRANDATKVVFDRHASSFDLILHTDFGDLGEARNEAVRRAKGEMVAFLDADDLWSSGWLTEAARTLNSKHAHCVLHCQYNVYFGRRYSVFVHPETKDPSFSYLALAYQNLWTALVAAPTRLLRNVPYQKADWRNGFGYEDWTWNCRILEHRIEHACVPKTVHFIRVKRSLSLSDSLKAIEAWRTPVDTFRRVLRKQA